MGVNRHRLSAGRHLSAGQLVRLTQDIYTYGNPCLNGDCIEITCDNPLPQCCQYEEILDALGVAGSDDTKAAEDQDFYGPSGSFAHANGGSKLDNFFGIGAINAFVPNHTQIFSENRKTHNNAADENHAPVFNIISNLNYARYHPEHKVHDEIPNVNYGALKKVIGTTPAFSMGDSSDIIDSLPTKANSGGIDHAFDRMTDEVVEKTTKLISASDPRIDPFSSNNNANEGQYRSFPAGSICEQINCNYANNICTCCGSGGTPCPPECDDFNACALGLCTNAEEAACDAAGACKCISIGGSAVCCENNQQDPCTNACGENTCEGNANGCLCEPPDIIPSDPCDNPSPQCSSPCDDNPCGSCETCVVNPFDCKSYNCVDQCGAGQDCCGGVCTDLCDDGGCPECGGDCCGPGEGCCSGGFGTDPYCAQSGCCDCPGTNCCNGSCCTDGQVCCGGVACQDPCNCGPDGQPVLCANGCETCVDGICTSQCPGDCCGIGPSAGCCENSDCCGGNCCGFEGPSGCCNNQCCASGNCCGDVCCSAGQDCVGGVCCEEDNVCGDQCGCEGTCCDGVCCPEGQFCCGDDIGCTPIPDCDCAAQTEGILRGSNLESLKGNFARRDILPLLYFRHDLNLGSSGNPVIGQRDTVMSCVLELTVGEVYGRLPFTGATPVVKPLKLDVYKLNVDIDPDTVSCSQRSTGNNWTSASGRNATDRGATPVSSITVGTDVKPLDKIYLDVTEIAREAVNGDGVLNIMIEAGEWFEDSTGIDANEDTSKHPAMLLEFYSGGNERPRVVTSINQGLSPTRLNPAAARRYASAGL